MLVPVYARRKDTFSINNQKRHNVEFQYHGSLISHQQVETRKTHIPASRSDTRMVSK